VRQEEQMKAAKEKREKERLEKVKA